MTKLTKPVTRRIRVAAVDAGIWSKRKPAADLVVTIAPEGIILRRYRTRTSFTLPYRRAFDSAAKLAADLIVANRLLGRRRSTKRGALRRSA